MVSDRQTYVVMAHVARARVEAAGERLREADACLSDAEEVLVRALAASERARAEVHAACDLFEQCARALGAADTAEAAE